MRLHVHEDCPLNKRAKIYLDGVEQKFCTIADDQEGYVKFMVKDPDGNFIEIFGLQEVVQREARGHVVIIDPAYPDEPLDKWRIAPKDWQER